MDLSPLSVGSYLAADVFLTTTAGSWFGSTSWFGEMIGC